MRKLPILSGALVGAALLVAACGGGSTTPTVPPVNVPSLAIPSFVIPTLPPVPSIAIPTLPSGSFAIPSFAIPSFNGDPTLAASFPKTVGGQTVSQVQTALYAELFSAFGGGNSEDAQRFAQSMTAIGVDPNTVSYGSAHVQLADSDTITAIRAPGYPAAQFLAAVPQLEAILQPDQPAPIVGQVSIGGKTVTTFTDSDEKVTYYYPSGDTIWTTDSTNPTDLAAIFAALP